MVEDRPTVLVVEDETSLRELYTTWLEDDYDVRTATSGAEAIEELDDDVAVVLLDRRIPGIDGDEVLEAIRGGGSDHRVAIVTAVEPDLDIVEMAFDEYVVKPTSREEVRAVVETLLALGAYDESFRTYYRLARKIARIEASVPADECATSERFQELTDSIDAAETDLDDARDALERDGYSALVDRTADSDGDADPEDPANE